MNAVESKKNDGRFATFGQELAGCWRQLPDKFFFLSLLAAWLSLFHFHGNSTFGYINTQSLFVWMWDSYSNTSPTSDESHGKIIPLVVLGLYWWKRRELLAARTGPWWPGIFIVAAALVLHAAGYVAQQPRAGIMAMFLGLYGLTGMAWGRDWLRKSFFPFFLFVFCIPLGVLAEFITLPLRFLVTWITAGFAHTVLGVDVVREGTQLFDSARTFRYDVAPACSGIRSLVAIFAVGTIYGFISFQKNSERLALIVLAFPLAVIGNVFRMLLIIVAAEMFGQDAGNFVHENWFFGLLPYVPAVFGMMWVGRWLQRRKISREINAEADAA